MKAKVPTKTVPNFHQTLHGYSRGHEMIASSVELPKIDQKRMLVLSDLSGSSRREFSPYITGYQLEESPFYALSKTWCASELKRPGCVWTHTLLVPLPLVGSLKTFDEFYKLFQHPKKKSPSFERYTKPLAFHSSKVAGSPSDSPSFPIREANIILSSLYLQRVEDPTVVLAENPEDYLKLVVEIWLQQWKSLRYQFSFCTYSLSPRKLGKQIFDLQIAPSQAEREFQSCGLSKILGARSIDSIVEPSVSKGIDVVIDDLRFPCRSKFREFLWKADDDANLKKEHFLKLGDLFVNSGLSEDNTSRSTLEGLNILSRLFPSIEEGNYYKRIFLDTFDGLCDQNACRTEEEILSALVYCESPEAIPPDLRAIPQRCDRAWRNDRESIINLVVHMFECRPNVLGEEVVRALGGRVTYADLALHATAKQRLLLLFAEFNPLLVSDCRAWCESVEFQKELLDKVPDCLKSDKEVFQSVLFAIFEGGSSDIAQNVFDKWGASATECFLEFLNHRTQKNRTSGFDRWEVLMRRSGQECVEWMRSKQCKVSSEVADLIVRNLDHDSEIIHSLTPSDWLLLINSVSKRVAASHGLRFAEIILPICFIVERSSKVMELVVFSFETIHRQLELNDLRYEVWRRLEPSLPSLTFFFQWDKCERLRRGIVDLFVTSDWPLDGFVRLTDDRRLMQLLVGSAQAHSKGKKLFKRIREDYPEAFM